MIRLRQTALLLCLCSFVFGQQIDLTPSRFDFDPDLTYDEDIASPADFIGYELGERFTIYEKSVNYFHYLASQSDRITINQYGETYEGRPLLNLIVTSAENQRNIASIRNRHMQLLEPGNMERADMNALLENDPVFTSFSYNIHGNEASSTEAAMQVAYRLAAARDAETQTILDQSVVIMYICINPDGRDRYVYWINGVGRNIPGINPNDLSHYAPWPNGRTNHYWFDLNRDWPWGVHPEARGLIEEYQKWMPQVHVDYHEQGYNSNYFTAPGTTPRNQLLPNSYEAWSDTFGRANIAEFEKQGIMYFTRDRFDFFYPGYGSSYPSVMGAIGMLTEQGGIGAGRAIQTNDDYILLLRQRVFDHYSTSIATIRKAAERRRELLQYSIAAWNASNSKETTETYVIRAEDNGFATDFLKVMHRNQIEVHKADADFSLSAAMDYRTGERSTQRFQAGDYIISADQSRHLFIHSLLARQMAIEDSVMYDMATWAAPLAYNLEAYSSPEPGSVASSLISSDDLQPPWGVYGANTAYAYVIDWEQRWAPKALSMLWARGYRVRAALEPFSDGSQTFGEGSLIVLRGRNLERELVMHEDMLEIADETQVRIYGAPSGRMTDGYDLASSRNRPVKQPRVAMLIEPPFNTYTCGQIYFLFDQETQLPVDRIRTSAFAQTGVPHFGFRYGLVDLNDYDVLILPGGGGGLRGLFGQEELDELNAWMRRGGTIVAVESAATFFSDQRGYEQVTIHRIEEDTTEQARELTYAEREAYYGKKRVPGSALLSEIDTTHPLGFGLKESLFDLKFGNTAILPSTGFQSVGLYADQADDLLVAGYASEENLEHLAGDAFAGFLPVGQGGIVYLLDNQHYRMFWRGGSRMLQNAVMLLPGF